MSKISSISFNKSEHRQEFIDLLVQAICQTQCARAAMKANNPYEALARYFAADRHEASEVLAMLPQDLRDEILTLAAASADLPGK